MQFNQENKNQGNVYNTVDVKVPIGLREIHLTAAEAEKIRSILDDHNYPKHAGKAMENADPSALTNKLPLQLTSHQQSLLADLCARLRGVVYSIRCDHPVNGGDLVDEIQDWMDVFKVTPQKLDELYDKLHRTGANS